MNLVELLQTLIGAVAGGIGAYAAIKERLGRIEENVKHAQQRGDEAMINSAQAHVRLAEHVERFHAK